MKEQIKINFNKILDFFERDEIAYLSMTIYFFFSALESTMFSEISQVELFAKIIRYVCYLIYLLIILSNIKEKNMFCDLYKYLKNHLLLIFIFLVDIIVMMLSKNKTPIILTLILWVSSFYNIEVIFKRYFFASFSFMIITWIFGIFNIIPDVVKFRGDTVRYSIGYIYPLETMTHFLFLVLIYIYIRKENFNYKDVICINLFNLLLFKITDGRTSFILIILSTMLVMLYYKSEQFKKFFIKIKPIYFYLFLFLCIFLPVVISYFYSKDNQFMIFLNRLVSNRFMLANKAFHTYGISLFGKQITWVGWGTVLDTKSINNYNFVDCSYIKNILDYGTVFMFICFIGYGYVYKVIKQSMNYLLLLLISIVFILCIMEPRLLAISMNPFVLLLNYFFMLKNENIIKFFRSFQEKY